MPEPRHGHTEIHLPGPSGTPLAFSLGLALTLGGLVPDSRLLRMALISIGLTIAVIAGWLWVRHAIDEYHDLPD